MSSLTRIAATISISCASLVALASCTSEKKPQAEASAKTETSTVKTSSGEGDVAVIVKPGEAGGSVESTYTTSAVVNGLDASTRRITLTNPNGTEATLVAGPEVRNFDQLRVGDKVTATVVERLFIFVRGPGEEPSVTHKVALARAPKGAKPGALVAESYEVTATVKSLDAANRTAGLQFVDGETLTIKVRPDVDMARYKVGDTVVIRVTSTLQLLAKTP
jgi:hypothetical protein